VSAPAQAPRELSGAELDAANAIYARIAFQPSVPGQDRTFGSFEGAELVALGRLSAYADGALELGGFWTRPDRRGRGHARALVAHSIAALPAGALAWCLPFDALVDFYRSFGMEPAEEGLAVPCSIAKKQGFCKEQTRAGTYERTALLVLRT
jgi:GNAT superfamily N-acetyltransferase